MFNAVAADIVSAGSSQNGCHETRLPVSTTSEAAPSRAGIAAVAAATCANDFTALIIAYMKSPATIFVALMLAGASLQAQGGNPIGDHLKAQWTNIRDLLTQMAEKMPEENYRFKPTAEMQDFGQRMAHVVGFNLRTCSMVSGAAKTPMVSNAPTKAEVTALVKESNAACDAVFNTLTDAEAMKMIPAGRGGMRPTFAVLESNVLEHSQEVYGYMAPYLRLRGIVPPSSDRNER